MMMMIDVLFTEARSEKVLRECIYVFVGIRTVFFFGHFNT